MFDVPLRSMGGCPDVVGFGVDRPSSRCPLDKATMLIPSSREVSMIDPVVPTPCTSPLGSIANRTRDGALQLTPVALPALAALQSAA